MTVGGLALLLTLLAAFDARPFAIDEQGVNIIIIDPGHGGNDAGNVGTGRYRSYEKDVSLEVSLLLKKYIEDNLPGTKAVLTRSTDEFIELYQRADIANRARADLFISIHCNAAPSHQAYGTESFVLGMGEKDQRLNRTAQMENASMLLEENWESNYEAIDPNNPATIIALRAYQTAFLEQSIDLASEIQSQFEQRVKRRNRGVKQQPLAVLRKSTMPGVLVELGFLTNSSEEDFLQSQRGKELLASGIFRAVRDYKFKRESRDALNKKGQESEGAVAAPSAASADDSSTTPTLNPDQSQALLAELLGAAADAPVYFSVQIAVSRNDLECLPENFRGLGGIWKKEEYGLFRYYCGRVTTFEEAQKLLEHAKATYSDAFLVAFEKGVKIDLSEAKKKLQ